jgi:hypothetical protein
MGPPGARQRRGVGGELTADVLAAIDEALGDAPVRVATLAPLAQEGVLHRRGSSSALAANRSSGNPGGATDRNPVAACRQN